jgi:lipid A 3-O-deacylase
VLFHFHCRLVWNPFKLEKSIHDPVAMTNINPFLRRVFSLLFTCGGLFAGMLSAHAEGFKPDSFFGELGGTGNQGYTATAGLIWALPLNRRWAGGEITAHAEALAMYWNARNERDNGRQGIGLLAVVPVLRYRFSEGASPWFAEGGIGASFTSKVIHTANKDFSTAFNFYDVLAVGRNFGADRRQELSLRAVHISNAGIKEPNPGENFLQLRYAVRF